MRKRLSIVGVAFLAFLIFIGAFVTVGGMNQLPDTTVIGYLYNIYKFVQGRVVSETTNDIILYVTTTGKDTNDCLTILTACATVQSAIDRVPKFVRHKVTINVGAGDFTAFAVTGYVFGNWYNSSSATDYQFQIIGANPINYTPVGGGTGSGTSTGGTTNTLIDAGQGWAVNALRGKLVYVNSTWFVVRKNDATSLETIGVSGSTMSGKAYVIQDWATVINTRRAFRAGSSYYSAAAVYSNVSSRYANDAVSLQFLKFSPGTASGTAFGLFADFSDLDLQYVSVDTCNYGIYIARAGSIRMANVVATTANSYYGITLYYITQVANTTTNIFTYNSLIGLYAAYGFDHYYNYVYSDGNSSHGIAAYYIPQFKIYYVNTDSNTGYGVLDYGTQYLRLTGTITNNTYGLGLGMVDIPSVAQIPVGVTGGYLDSLTISNNTNSAIYAGNGAKMRCIGVVGTGNGGSGIYARYGAVVFTSNLTTVTGAVGDVNLGGTEYSYASDFASDGNYKIDLSEGTIIKRKDSMTFP